MALNLFQGSNLLASFLKDKTIPQFYTPDVQNQVELAARGLSEKVAANLADLGRFGESVRKAKGAVEQLGLQDIGTLGNLIASGQAYNPFGEFSNVWNLVKGGAQDFAKSLQDVGKGNLNALRARMYGGRGGGSYDTKLELDRLSKNIAPYWAQMFSSVGPTAASLAGQRMANLGSVVDLINQRAGVPMRAATLDMLPAEQRMKLAAAEAGLLGTLGDIGRANVAGFKTERNPWVNAIASMEAPLNSVTNDVWDIAKDAARSYLGGGMMGGFGGMGGGLSSLGGFSQQFGGWQGATGYPGSPGAPGSPWFDVPMAMQPSVRGSRGLPENYWALSPAQLGDWNRYWQYYQPGVQNPWG